MSFDGNISIRPTLSCHPADQVDDMADDPSGPPQPPEVHPRLRMRPSERVGVGLLTVLPLLAVLGWFGPTLERASDQAGPLKLEVEYPARLRFHMVEQLVARVTNMGQGPLRQVTLAFDSAYIQAFTEVIFTPEADRAHVVELQQIQPGEARLVSVELKADGYGLNRGEVSAAYGDTRVAVTLSTWVLP
jgi:hypothetical protein